MSDANTTNINAFGRLLHRASGTWPDRAAIVFPDSRQTYAELYERSVWRARQLIALGVQPGEHVGILLPTSPEFVEIMFGTALAGAVMVPINARYRAGELTYIAENADMVTIVTAGQVADGVNLLERLTEGLPGIDQAADPANLELGDIPKLRNVLVLGDSPAAGMLCEPDIEDKAEAVPDEETGRRRDAVKDDDLSMILYTSGTTSNPKGCMLTGASIIHNGRTLADVYEMTEQDSFWSPLPMFHIAATLPIAGCVDRGAAYVTMPYFEAGTALRLLEEEKATVTYPCFVTIISDLINHPDFDRTDLSHARVMNSNLAVQPPGFAEKLAKAMPNCVQFGTYGLSEASGTVTSSRMDDPVELRTTRLGTPMPGQEVRIVDLETGEDVPTGEKGEILVRGYNVLKGYYRDPEKTAQAIDSDGWLHTGDVGSLDEHGTIMFHGRDKDMLKVGGENVAAAEIEALCQKHPAVKLCQVVPAPDDRLQEVAAAFIELKEGETVTEDELIEFCRGKIASFKIPRYVRTVSEWPMSTTKVQKYKLKDQIEAELKKQRGAAE